MNERTAGQQPTSVGTLTDEEIRSLSRAGQLITGGFVEANIKQACYELTVGDVYYDLANGKRRHELKPGGYVLVKPKQLIVVITAETLELPAHMLGRILTKGHLFSLGLLPVNTYADPGFSGRLGIVLYNVSDNYLKLPLGEPVAKIEFSKLQNPVARPYHGQHGYETKIWPMRDDLVLSDAEAIWDRRVGSATEEIELAYGRSIGRIVKRVFRFERHLLIASFIYFAATIGLIGVTATTGWTSALVNVGLGIGANMVSAIIVYVATNLKTRS